MIRVFVSPSSHNRLRAALDFAHERAGSAEMLVLAATREAADDLVRELTLSRRATFGIQRASPLQLASRLSVPAMTEGGLAPATGLAVQAVAARAAFEVHARGELNTLGPVIEFPGFPAALAETLHELRARESLPASSRVRARKTFPESPPSTPRGSTRICSAMPRPSTSWRPGR